MNTGNNREDQSERERLNESGEPRRGTPDPGPMKKK